MAGKYLKENTGHIGNDTEKEILINMIHILVSKGELSENEGRKTTQFLTATGFGRR